MVPADPSRRIGVRRLAVAEQPGSVPDRLFFTNGGTLYAYSRVPPSGWQPPVALAGPNLCGPNQCPG